MIGIDTVAHLGRLIVCLHLVQRGLVMELHDSKQIRGELVALLDEQLDALERETFGGVTEAELCAYEDRHDRISKLYDELLKREAAA
jgi:hypothetical protein